MSETTDTAPAYRTISETNVSNDATGMSLTRTVDVISGDRFELTQNSPRAVTFRRPESLNESWDESAFWEPNPTRVMIRTNVAIQDENGIPRTTTQEIFIDEEVKPRTDFETDEQWSDYLMGVIAELEPTGGNIPSDVTRTIFSPTETFMEGMRSALERTTNLLSIGRDGMTQGSEPWIDSLNWAFDIARIGIDDSEIIRAVTDDGELNPEYPINNILRYPKSADGPHLVFERRVHRFAQAIRTNSEPLGAVILPLPKGFQIGDSFSYKDDNYTLRDQLQEEALIRAIQNRGAITNPSEYINSAMSRLSDMDTAVRNIGQAIGSINAAQLGEFVLNRAAENNNITGQFLSSVGHLTGVAKNPRQFIHFQGPNLRSFSFSFSFVPKNKSDSDAAIEIIKFFRQSAYPRLSGGELFYLVPHNFLISIAGSSDIIKIPNCYIESVNVTYNPSNNSYFKHNNRPVEIDMTLGFKEIYAISSEDVDEGY
jgi:hypothetical protein